MKSSLKYEVNFVWDFAEVEYTTATMEKMEHLTVQVRDAVSSVLGKPTNEKAAWNIDVRHRKLIDLP
jgi:hypothetical protein